MRLIVVICAFYRRLKKPIDQDVHEKKRVANSQSRRDDKRANSNKFCQMSPTALNTHTNVKRDINAIRMYSSRVKKIYMYLELE